MDKLEAMQRFMLVAQTGSFTRAAEMLGLPKSSISAAVTALEKQLGARLFHRSTRSIVLTQDGEVYLPQCRAILAELDALESQFQHQGSAVRGVLRVDMPSRFASSVVIPHVANWLDCYPNVQLKISSADYRIDPVKEGIDCVIRIGTLDDSALVAKPLAVYQVANVVSPDYIKKFGKPKTLASLQHHRLIDYSHGLSNSQAIFEYVEQNRYKELSMPSALAVSGTDAYLAACLAGLGIAQIPLAGLRTFLADGSLVRVLPNHEAEPMPVTLLYPSRRQMPKRLSVFIDWLQALVTRLEVS